MDEAPLVTEYLHKIVVAGPSGCGKTSILRRYVNNEFFQQYKPTIGVDFALKVIDWNKSTKIRFQLWDIAGQESIGNMTRIYYKAAVGAILVYDVTRPNTIEAVKKIKWKNDIDKHMSTPECKLPCLLLANQSDLLDKPLDKEKMDQYCKENCFITWFETSAKDNIGISKAVHALMEVIMRREPEEEIKLMKQIDPALTNVLRYHNFEGESLEYVKKTIFEWFLLEKGIPPSERNNTIQRKPQSLIESINELGTFLRNQFNWLRH